MSTPVKELIQSILTPDPSQRPSLHEIVDHYWFTAGTVPSYIPISAHDAPPDFRHVARHMSESNLARLRRNALLDEDQVTSIAVPTAPQPTIPNSKSRTSSLAQQEKEFQKAVQPGSPISALLSSARQPLMVAPPANLASRNEGPLIRKLQAAKDSLKSPGRHYAHRGLQHIVEEHEDEYGARVEELRRKELESQKARIVAQMVPAPGSAPGSAFGGDDQEHEAENVPPARTRDAALLLKERERLRKEKEREKERETAKERAETVKERDVQEMPPPAGLPLRVNSFDAAAQTLIAAFDAKNQGRVFRDPAEDANLPPPKVFIVSWVDYCNKYGMGYALSDGSVGVHFNDSSSVILSPDKVYVPPIACLETVADWFGASFTATLTTLPRGEAVPSTCARTTRSRSTLKSSRARSTSSSTSSGTSWTGCSVTTGTSMRTPIGRRAWNSCRSISA